MATVSFSFPDVPAFARAMREAAPKHLTRATGKALYKIGKSDLEKFKPTLDSAFNIRQKRFRNQFKFRSTDARQAKSIDQLQLSEYTGAKLFRIFQEGGDIQPALSRTLTILTDAARTSGGKRKYSQKEIQAMIASGQCKIIKMKSGPPAVVLIDEKFTKSGKLRAGSKYTILAWLQPKIHETKRIDFFGNFDANASAHEAILNEAALEAILKTEADKSQ